MIVDFHTHVLAEGWLPAPVLEGFAPLYRRLIGRPDLDDATIHRHFAGMYDPDGARILADMTAAGRDLGFAPVVNFEQGLRHTLAWYREMSLPRPARG